jgi:hypothetical protein
MLENNLEINRHLLSIMEITRNHLSANPRKTVPRALASRSRAGGAFARTF